jgi:hypothetical protein
MKNFTQLLKPKFQVFQQRRYIFDNEAAPPSPETFKSTEKASDAQIANEVGPMSPKQMASGAAGRTTAIRTKYIQKAGFLAGLIATAGTQTGTSQTSSQTTSATDDSNKTNITDKQ